MGRNLYLLKVESPEIAARIESGQFVHTLVPGMEGHILRRPFSVYDADAETGVIEILYQTVGFGSSRLSSIEPGSQVSNIGPVGNGWKVPAGCARALLVGGGVGAAPLFMFAKRLVSLGVDIDVVLGAQTA
ncbi:MAG: dihydroorotate dehydrogenase electron transfer subunit, partial [Eggerthellaceae bacterium]|nr:dihydroorotate dehydrogenase electron transfer subunit [Eggerthellaceae bacterium]